MDSLSGVSEPLAGHMAMTKITLRKGWTFETEQHGLMALCDPFEVPHHRGGVEPTKDLGEIDDPILLIGQLQHAPGWSESAEVVEATRCAARCATACNRDPSRSCVGERGCLQDLIIINDFTSCV